MTARTRVHLHSVVGGKCMRVRYVWSNYTHSRVFNCLCGAKCTRVRGIGLVVINTAVCTLNMPKRSRYQLVVVHLDGQQTRATGRGQTVLRHLAFTFHSASFS